MSCQDPIADDRPRFLLPDAPLAGLARGWLDALLARDRRRAGELVLRALDAGAALEDVYLHVFQPAQYEIGWLWQTGRISVGHEHYCTNATQTAMAQLYPRLFRAPPGPRRALSACVEGELHELGLRMVADFFTMSGWDSDFLGADTPIEGVVRFVEERPVDVLAVGVTLHPHLERAARLIAAVRASPAGRGARILVGGYPLRAVEGLWREVGADGTAADAAGAVALGERLVGQAR